MMGDYLAALDMHDLDTSAIYGEEYFASEITFLSLSMGNYGRRFHHAFCVKWSDIKNCFKC